MTRHIKYSYTIILCCLALISCKNEESSSEDYNKDTKSYKFRGDYNKSFNDLHDLHIAAATKNGITPMTSKDDTAKLKYVLIRIPENLPLYKTDKLTHSVPYLIPKAADLVTEISIRFRDSLISKKIPLHKPILTSLTRTDDDIKGLTKRNGNASQNSAHCYGTTFDISWKRFEKVNPFGEEVNTEKLKFVLAQVLFDLQKNKKCYIKHEKKQACFHITVR